MKRTFLDWNQPCIPALVEHLLSQHGVSDAQFYDLSEYVLVFPNRAASKRFLTVLSDYAWKNQCTIEPPRVKHMGDFMELLYEQKVPCASLLGQQVVWMKALRQVYKTQPDFFTVMFPFPPEDNDQLAWYQMGADMVEIFQELARENMNFAYVAQACHQLAENKNSTENCTFPETEVRRWDMLAQVESIYFQHLNALGLWDRQAARLFALQNTQTSVSPTATSPIPGNSSHDFQISFRLGIVGCVDLNRLQREFLCRVSANVEVFVFAPEAMCDYFEEDGCLKTGMWTHVPAELNKKLFRVLVQETKPEEQVGAIVKWLRKIAPKMGIEEVTLGLADETLEPLLLQELATVGVATTRAGKKTLSDLQPWKMLERMGAYLQSVASAQPGQPLATIMEKTGPEYSELALFLRQEDFGNYIRSLRDDVGNPLVSGDWISELDKYYNEYYPSRMPSPEEMFRRLQADGRWKQYKALCWVYRHLHFMLLEYACEFSNFHSLLTIVVHFLKKIYCWQANYDASNEREYQIIRGCMDLNHVFSDKFQLPQVLQADLSLTLPQALQILLAQTATKQMPTSGIPQTISIQRWLDLPLDDAPAMALIGMNENYVPEAITEHLFLPNQLRQKLCIKTNQNRFERDVYNLSLILASREEVCVTLGRLTTAGDVLFPSRLLLTEQSDALISQVKQLFEEPKEPETAENQERNCAQAFKGATDNGLSLFETPPISTVLPPIREMSVTDFSVFITNPYLFYLQRYLRLQTVSDFAQELDSASFGNLLHRVVQLFGQEEIARAVNPVERASMLKDEAHFKDETLRIQNLFTALLDKAIAEHFTTDTLPVVDLQFAQLRERLLVLAEKQAEQYREGWQIWAVERKFCAYLRENSGRGEVLMFGKDTPSPMRIHGRIDRIDYRVLENGNREWRVWDYKTFDKTPAQKHFGKDNVPALLTADEWKDLQLPLYLHLIRSEKRSEEVDRWQDLCEIDTTHLRAGYILVSKKADETQFIEADWTDNLLESAEQRIREIAAAVHDRELQNNGEMEYWDRKTIVEWILNPN